MIMLNRSSKEVSTSLAALIEQRYKMLDRHKEELARIDNVIAIAQAELNLLILHEVGCT